MQIRTRWFQAGLVAVLALFAAPAGNAAGAGQAVYERECAQCHGAGGKGDGEEAQYLTTLPKDFRSGALDKRSDEFLAAVVAKGGPAKGLSDSMPAFPKLSKAELDAVIAYVRQLGRGGAGQPAK
ncbi:MAG TPA: cytochrome c [Myxococcales bacterium]|nr:cytochrome c [Myxococcales bacterium]